MRHTVRRSVAALAAAGMLAGCAAERSGGGTGGTGTAQGVTATAVRIGGVLTKTSASGYSTKDAELGAKARFERANAEGGVRGRTIDFLDLLAKTGKDLTRETFLATANGSYAYDNPGFGRIRYPKDHSEPNGCGALVKLEGGAFQVARSMKCFDNVPLK